METLSIATTILVVINIVGVAYSYGKLSQKVTDMAKHMNDMSHRLERLENKRG